MFLLFVVLWLLNDLVLTPSTYAVDSAFYLWNSTNKSVRKIRILLQYTVLVWLQELRKTDITNIK